MVSLDLAPGYAIRGYNFHFRIVEYQPLTTVFEHPSSHRTALSPLCLRLLVRTVTTVL